MSKSTKINKSTKNAKSDTNKKEEVEQSKEVEENKQEKNESLTISNIFSPYINTTLVSPVILYPNQMDNKMYLHIKDNLTNKLVGRCYRDYGYIVKIYKIDEISDGIIEPEDPSCSSKFIVKFSCKLCFPIKNKEIIFKIRELNKNMIVAVNGPLITALGLDMDSYNVNKFYIDNNGYMRIRETSDILLPNAYVKILVRAFKNGDYQKEIFVIGFLQDVATQEEYEKYYQNDN